ncbi:MAG: 2-oxoglutarate dehydrogenase E1 component [Proteobacteria bacterium]|nr:2-oxoglutarate dehydrogenase E1 component [Pseudomonadota bacterium]
MQPDLRNFEYLKSINAEYIEDLYLSYQKDPESIDPSWRYFFDGIYLGEVTTLVEAASAVEAAGGLAVGAPTGTSADLDREFKVFQLIEAYRTHGHLLAKVNPVFENPSSTPELELSRFGLADADLDQSFEAARFIGLPKSPLRSILSTLQAIYCGPVGIELAHLQTETEREFVRSRFESLLGNYTVQAEDKKFILKRLTESETLERFIHTRYVAQKRFSIEGGEALIPGLDAIIETATSLGAEEVVFGMAHRGRLNVLINTLRKNPEMLFSEFDDNYRLSTDHGEGDVKYHKGHSLDHVTRQGKPVHLSMGFNPSHLEFINPVVMGMARAKQRQRKDTNRSKVLSVLMHGDAAFAGQGVVYESIQASRLEGYSVGGSIHVISNNQVGFTTDPKDSRSTRYCTDLAKAFDTPVFHVNGDDPEALWITLKIATEFRYLFKKDVFIDLLCYRKYGHNEGDEPSFTQPQLYKMISSHATPREVYANRLAEEGVMSAEDSKLLQELAQDPLIRALEKVRAEKPEPVYSQFSGPYWSKYRHAHGDELLKPVKTGVNANDLITLSKKINRFPEGFKVHPKLERLFEGRIQALEAGKGIDWGNAEVLAYASLVNEGIPVRMTGQDVRRGTFTHRHAAAVDYITNETRIGINELHPEARLSIYNSHLSETAAMGIEFGYSVSDPDSLVIWEAQFGDFANGAQVMIDQFLATSESKWHRASGLTLLLPHGFEGQGPEHSSARLERFLQLCGKENFTVAYPTTPAQIFHLLRRQVKRNFRKPLVVMTPKSLLRHPKAVSELADLTDSYFHEVLDDSLLAGPQAASSVKRIMVCSGKIYYELIEEREKRGANHIAILRLEQFYPWPEQQLASIIEKYGHAKELFFVQEEPRNMGAWTFFSGMWSGTLANFGARFPGLSLTYVGREICASPAVGSKKLHDKEQQEIILKAFQD